MTDAADGLSATDSGITVNPAAATSLAIVGLPTTATAGLTNSFTVAALDPYGNIATGFLDTVQFTSSDGSAVLPVAYTFTDADQGLHTFFAVFETTGSQSLTATDVTSPGISGSVESIQVDGAAASSLVITDLPAITTAGAVLNMTITAYDANGNVATGYTGTVQFMSTDPQAALPAAYIFTAASGGSHTFSLALKTAGLQSITATDAADGLSATDSGITVKPAEADSLTVTGFPTTDTAGVAE